MGCVSSKQDINDIHPNIFNVMNVNENGQNISHGQLELTESELILFQRCKTETRWPLRCLRRYGFDSEIFSFEAGRRCTTGPGIYAFRCRRAEQLFNLLQSYIQLRNLSDDLANVAINDLQIPAITSGPPVQLRNPEAQYLPQNSRIQNFRNSSRPGSVTSNNGPPSPPALPPGNFNLPTPPPLEKIPGNPGNPLNFPEFNNNKNHIAPNNSETTPTMVPPVNLGQVASAEGAYMNLIVPKSPTISLNSEPYARLDLENPNQDVLEDHVYINVILDEAKNLRDIRKSSIQDNLMDGDSDDKHCYANLNPDEVEKLQLLPPPNQNSINYIVLDLKDTQMSNNVSNLTVDTCQVSNLTTKGYATIDFNKTVALSNSLNHQISQENDGSRKTRHNSTIGDIAPILARHSTSLSD